MASTGQESTQAPQSMQPEASITYLASPSEIALVGHSASQAPQLMQSSLIRYAIKYTSFDFISYFTIPPQKSKQVHKIFIRFL